MCREQRPLFHQQLTLFLRQEQEGWPVFRHRRVIVCFLRRHTSEELQV